MISVLDFIYSPVVTINSRECSGLRKRSVMRRLRANYDNTAREKTARKLNGVDPACGPFHGLRLCTSTALRQHLKWLPLA